MNNYKCPHCKDTGINSYEDYHADSTEIVYQPCPFCDLGKTIDPATVPENEWLYLNRFLSWEERVDPVTLREDF